MTLPNLVSISGYSFSGKDAAADALVERAGFAKTHMSTFVEQALVKLDPWIVDHKEGSVERFSELYENLGDAAIKNYQEVRRLLYTLETEVGRENGENIWVKQVFEEIHFLLEAGEKVVLVGPKTKDELELVRIYGGVCVWISRPMKTNTGVSITSDDCDLIVKNDGNLSDLYVNLVVALEEYNPLRDEDKDE